MVLALEGFFSLLHAPASLTQPTWANTRTQPGRKTAPMARPTATDLANTPPPRTPTPSTRLVLERGAYRRPVVLGHGRVSVVSQLEADDVRDGVLVEDSHQAQQPVVRGVCLQSIQRQVQRPVARIERSQRAVVGLGTDKERTR